MRLSDISRHSFDINIILGNLLENAIEAARQTEEKKLTIAIREEKGVLRIHIENSYNGILNKRGQNFSQQKKTAICMVWALAMWKTSCENIMAR